MDTHTEAHKGNSPDKLTLSMCVLWTPLLSSLWADVVVERCYPLGTYRIHTSDFILCGEAFGEKKNQGQTDLHSCQRATGTMPLFS